MANGLRQFDRHCSTTRRNRTPLLAHSILPFLTPSILPFLAPRCRRISSEVAHSTALQRKDSNSLNPSNMACAQSVTDGQIAGKDLPKYLTFFQQCN